MELKSGARKIGCAPSHLSAHSRRNIQMPAPDPSKKSMSVLNIKPADSCRYDLIALGEVMLRLDPGEGRVRTAREFSVWEGGGEYNVARGLRRCFGLKAGICTAFAENDVGRLLEDCILQGGVDPTFIKWVPYDGIGRTVRNGLNFTERGFGLRGAVGTSDRGHSAASQLRRGDFDWEEIFGRLGARWFHTGGIFAGLSETTPEVIQEAISAARKHSTIISYDLNYRRSLWQGLGGLKRAQEVNKAIARHVDVIIGNEEDFTACLGLAVEGIDEQISRIDIAAFKKMITELVAAYPNVKLAATTLRTVRSASINDWGAICWAGGEFYQAPTREALDVLDRIGGGDSFASGLIYGLMQFGDPQKAVEYGAAHGALAMTTPGDTSMATLKEVEGLVKGGSARVRR
jgi:2-dehydro-3-deoxygluconokinase